MKDMFWIFVICVVFGFLVADSVHSDSYVKRMVECKCINIAEQTETK